MQRGARTRRAALCRTNMIMHLCLACATVRLHYMGKCTRVARAHALKPECHKSHAQLHYRPSPPCLAQPRAPHHRHHHHCSAHHRHPPFQLRARSVDGLLLRRTRTASRRSAAAAAACTHRARVARARRSLINVVRAARPAHGGPIRCGGPVRDGFIRRPCAYTCVHIAISVCARIICNQNSRA